VYKDGEYSFTMPSATALHHYLNHYTANLNQGGLKLSGTAMSVYHFTHVRRQCHSTFILGFTLGAAGVRAQIASGQFTVTGRTVLNGQQAIELKFNVPPNSEAPPHVTAERMWVNATTYLPMRDYTRWSNGQQSVFDYVFLPPTAERMAKLRPVIPAGYTRAACGQAPARNRARGGPLLRASQIRWPGRSGGPARPLVHEKEERIQVNPERAAVTRWPESSRPRGRPRGDNRARTTAAGEDAVAPPRRHAGDQGRRAGVAHPGRPVAGTGMPDRPR
jgi:hypothetical protein